MKIITLNKGCVTTVDDEDYMSLSMHEWKAIRAGAKGNWHFYAVRYIPHPSKPKQKTSLLMHRAIMNQPKGMEVDHINGDTLDNQRSNLRICTHADNMKNRVKVAKCTSTFKGVYWHKKSKKWAASISSAGILKHLGMYVSEIEAAKVYDEAARRLYGEFARLNFPS